MNPLRLTFTPALPCADCQHETTQGLIYLVNPLAWQLVPLCDKDIEGPGKACEEEPCASSSDLQQLVTSRIEVLKRLQRTRRQLARAYVQMRRQRAHSKAQRSFRWRLRRISQVEAREVQG